jgi:predicted alpha/beta hydrolase
MWQRASSREFDVPIYNFRTRGPEASDQGITEVEFPDDAAATADARQALADAARNAALENRNTLDEIVVTSPTGVVIATVTLLGC